MNPKMMALNGPSAGFLAALLLLLSINCCCALSSGVTPPKATISVCTGPDCLVDGASGCIRQLQTAVASNADIKASVRVTGRACIGPCGDGPCVTVTDVNGDRVLVRQPSKTQIALVEPGMFASSPKGWYQVRTQEQLQEVLAIASGVEPYETNSDASFVLTSTRAWYDRPRNERKVLQRLMQFLIGAGLYRYSHEKGAELGNLQYGIAFVLWVLSEFILEENLWTLLYSRLKK